VTSLDVGPLADEGGGEVESANARAKRTYSEGVAAARDLMAGVRMGAAPSLRRIKRVVQSIVDQILKDETSLIGLTTIRDHDVYTFTHSVNVCIFGVALGKRLGMSKVQMYDLGMAALFHDIGKSRVRRELTEKPEGLTEDEWREMAAHPWLGVLALFNVRGGQELPYRAMLVSLEHHMKRDLTGYPKPVRARELGIFTRIVSVVDAFDAATSRRAYQAEPYTPAHVMAELRDNPARGMDPIVVKAFISLTGIYPVGTLVILDTFELGIVHAPNSIKELLSRPVVRIVSDAQGNIVHPGTLVDLGDRAEDGDGYLRSIIKTADPNQYGLRVSDYFV
jgi:HD-GYP domain-containing protein (c-di-GMP phosphodiesterase class II)